LSPEPVFPPTFDWLAIRPDERSGHSPCDTAFARTHSHISTERIPKMLTPFVLHDSSQFRPGPPYPATQKKYPADFNEVKSLGGDGITTPSARTADQTEIALYWWESSPLKWNRIARIVSVNTGLDLWENALLFGLLNMALADGYIATVSTKNHYNYWRPVTAILLAFFNRGGR
jgi:hypothetical protein